MYPLIKREDDNDELNQPRHACTPTIKRDREDDNEPPQLKWKKVKKEAKTEELQPKWKVEKQEDKDFLCLKDILPSPTLEKSTLVPNSRVFADLVAMLKGLLPLLSPDFTLPTKADQTLPNHDITPAEKERILHNAFLAHVYKESDKLLPFRTSAASQKRILAPGGPYDPQHLQTKAGLFSALIYRGITYHTQFLINNKTVFQDLDDWKKTLKEAHNYAHRKDKKYFCRMDAYGSAAKARQVGNATGYWQLVSTDTDFTAWLTSEKKISAVDLFRKIEKACYGFGSLTTYFIVMDYVESGLTEPVTLDDIAKFISMLRMGGKTGLAALGYKVKNSAQIHQAFTSLHAALSEALSADEQRRMNFGPILIEFSLCKLGRMKETFRAWRQAATQLALG